MRATIEEQILTHTAGLMGSAEVAYLIKGFVQIPVVALIPAKNATIAETILQMLEDGWTAIPF